jgi:hypothetical protein
MHKTMGNCKRSQTSVYICSRVNLQIQMAIQWGLNRPVEFALKGAAKAWLTNLCLKCDWASANWLTIM